MKIVYVYDSIARIGGMERILTDKMNYLAEIYGHEVYLITSSQGNHPFSFPLSHKVEHIDLDTKFHLQYQHPLLEQLRVGWTLNHKFEQKLKKEIKLINPDIISGNTSFKADLICKLDCKAKKIIESHCAKIYIIRKTKCFDFWERNVLFPKTKRSFFRTPKHPLPCPFPLNFSLLIITKKFGNLAKNRYICIV